MTAGTVPHQDDAEPSDAQVAAHRLRWWRELLYVAVFYAIYSWVRNLFGSQGTGEDIDASVAFEHARQIIDLERTLGLYFEASLQRWYLDLPAMGLIRVWNIFYGTAHLLITTAVAIVGFASYSLMPPRLLDDPGKYGACRLYAPEAASSAPPGDKSVEGCDRYGYVDTLVVHGGWISFDDEKAAGLTNQYAAMPSMHIGWSVWSALVLVPMMRRGWARVLAWSYPLLTLFTIIVTANHYWIDAIGGLAALAVGATVARWLTARFQARQVRAGLSATTA
jgi:hypothetical protein